MPWSVFFWYWIILVSSIWLNNNFSGGCSQLADLIWSSSDLYLVGKTVHLLEHYPYLPFNLFQEANPVRGYKIEVSKVSRHDTDMVMIVNDVIIMNRSLHSVLWVCKWVVVSDVICCDIKSLWYLSQLAVFGCRKYRAMRTASTAISQNLNTIATDEVHWKNNNCSFAWQKLWRKKQS